MESKQGSKQRAKEVTYDAFFDFAILLGSKCQN